ncbi:MAG TPA: K(+)-transporting ATPase subunit B [Marinilabiliales bacterium]|jgi:K+-transporting ATPase ATPase B chain|nr:MAG: potassium-transporting ATPase subunit B [Bacteroidetes bacterium GWA2_40_14]OFX61763.1 MAG: potassium-transporting ATPase subunit B [Bacteroidetes bacterium GWC2_40_13]OFX76020.1 MAG: potassium-transporting ATPase subunit B [Bacteroidetes bacterium GWD2_40_43]OFX94366.1 MAG: potassium-transporting ATPase subunit B [Bacteroidetes bacterium GWE2_40_63]OFY18845.1 MAG: potassium-transporting ATPase subunit B [Bacteroidetes bacterium GWF2_40_13]OFZ24820.1 MAG: potassium-transporting ATPase 
MTKQDTSLFNKKILLQAAKNSIIKLNPASLIKNPVIFIVAVGSLLTTIAVFAGLFQGNFSSFSLQIAIWLWFTVLFANFSEAIAEGRGKAQADSLRNSRIQAKARKMEGKHEISVYATDLKKDDIVVCEAGDVIPSDGEVIEGIASVDESAITGESAPVIRESGGDRSAVTGGTKVISDRILVRITTEPGSTFIDRMIALVEGAKRQKTPNEIALSILLSGLSIIFLLAVVTLPAFFGYSLLASGLPMSQNLSIPVLIALLVCLIPTTIGGLLSAIGISGMDRLLQRNVIATSGRAIEAAGDVDVLLLDKTGTITLGNRMATDFIADEGVTVEQLADAAQFSSLSDETPEGRSIVILAKEKFNIRGREIHQLNATFIPFTAQSKMSGVDFKTEDGQFHQIRKGASEAIRTFVLNNNGYFPQKIQETVSELARQGATPLVVAEDNKVLGVIHLKDIVKGGIKQRFAELRKMGIKTVMITGDNSLTAAAIAAEAGVDDFMAEATPEDKLKRIREEQANGHLVGMIGDGTNDAPALAQADIGIAMNSGTQAAREAGNMVDLDSNPTKLIEVVEVGKQLLMTRGSLTTFSIANDVAKYFAIIPAIAISLYSGNSGVGPLSALNIMNLASPQSAVLSAVIFNAIIIMLLVPLALRGVRYRPVSANEALTRNLLIFGLGGLVAPFVGIKLIDVLLNL